MGRVFDIIRSSAVDGPGIRTTVFFKGCNLHCSWCHNPESQSAEKQMLFYRSKCTGCGKCKQICPNEFKKCDFCGKCALYCPNDARAVCGQDMTADEVVRTVRKDREFYLASGGGVTFSGGECMLQIEFLSELLHACRREGIHTAVDTAGCVPFSHFEKILPETDLFLYDVKAISPDVYRTYIGGDGAQILDNYKRLLERGAKVIVRIPLIPEVNGTDEEFAKIVAFLRAYPPQSVEVLPYHTMGGNKYAALGKTPAVFSVPTPERLRECRSYFQ